MIIILIIIIIIIIIIILFYFCFSFCFQLLSILDESNISLAEQIMNNLLGRQVDQNYMVRMYCIRGLGNMADIKGNEVRMNVPERA